MRPLNGVDQTASLIACDADCPVWTFFADTFNTPLASTANVTSIFGSPTRASGIWSNSNTANCLHSAESSLAPRPYMI